MTNLHALLEAWTAGWAHSRGTPPPQPRPYGFELHVGLPGHVSRHALAAPDPAALRTLTQAITQPGILLKVCAPPDVVAPLLPAAWRVTAVNTLMSAPLEGGPAPSDAPAGFAVSDVAGAGALRAIAVHRGPALAASGRIGLHGRHAVFDQIETLPDFQRRGLGRFVMQQLGERARRAGATQGVLAATEAGQALYTAMGWRVESLLTTAERSG